MGIAHVGFEGEGAGVLDEFTDFVAEVGKALNVDYQGPWGRLDGEPLLRLALLLTAAAHVLVISLKGFNCAEAAKALL